MQAQYELQSTREAQAEVARLLLEANLAYGESNSAELSYVQRLKARQECRGLLKAALSLEPAHAGGLGLLGRIELDDGRPDQARDLFLASLEAEPEQAQQYSNLGYWALKTERPALAEQYFLQALELDRGSATAFSGVAHAKRLQGQFDVAYLHYRKLLEMGMAWDSVYAGMLHCAAHLNVDRSDPSLAQDAINLLRRDGLPHQDIARFVAAIIHQQYDLDNANAEVLLDAAASDELLLLALQKLVMPDPAVEELVTMLRRSIISEVAQTVALRDELQSLCIGIAIYNNRTGYALTSQDDEERLVSTINESISAQFAVREEQDAMIGSLMISAMYGALFHQSFAANLGQWGIRDWPLALQPMLASAYYDLADDEAIKQNFAEKADELCLAKSDVPQAWPSWPQLAHQTETSLRDIITQDLRLDTSHLPDTVRILVCGAQSGQRAMELARYLSDVEIVAVDESLANIARATRLAERLGLDNIVFWPWSIAQRFVADGHQVHWVEVGRLPSESMTELSLAALINDAAASGAIVHLHTGVSDQTSADKQIRQLIEQHQLTPTRPALRQLRRVVLNHANDEGMPELLADFDFYSLDGCRDRWFRPQDTRQLQEMLALLSNEVDWKLVKARDTDGHTLATLPVQRQIQAEALGSEVQSLMGQNLSVYFQRRR
ncbi:hypothetical protein MSNKSG1_08643 [Marinobacter santoriniensis NKSG1]|uniref:Uncharacterized protein n=1 Tax=Marinobacter santoriniensis NKSG1 TaxID=1288826 RepID=M7CQL4_9GAMM|nr:hypothetical protein [Marinobacter santoriniensis]EMP55926.1 hypothetical protein MSNKSG1_08643 [Marinobacter santoriniensis NKSG1]